MSGGGNMNLILIGGGSGSGKTILASHLKEYLIREGCRVLNLPMDSYYYDLRHIPPAEAAERNFDVPEAFDIACLEADYRALEQGGAIQRRIYDYRTHTVHFGETLRGPYDWVIVEGLFALNIRMLYERALLKLYIRADDHVRMSRRAERDISERDLENADISNEILARVMEMHEKHVEPVAARAEFIIENNADSPDEMFALAEKYLVGKVELVLR